MFRFILSPAVVVAATSAILGNDTDIAKSKAQAAIAICKIKGQPCARCAVCDCEVCKCDTACPFCQDNGDCAAAKAKAVAALKRIKEKVGPSSPQPVPAPARQVNVPAGVRYTVINGRLYQISDCPNGNCPTR